MLFEAKKTPTIERRTAPARKPVQIIKLRPYQDAAVQSLRDFFLSGNTGNPLVVMPTGTGKSIVIAEFVRWAVRSYPKTRVVMVTHVKELVAQNAEKLRAIWPSAPLGIYSAGLRSRDVAPITYGSIQTLYNKAHELGHVHLVVVDEAHMIPAKKEAMYQRFFNDLRAINPKLRVVGLTATPFRMDVGSLLDGELFDEIVYDCASREAFVEFVEEGYLCPLFPIRTDQAYDVSSVRITGGEFNARDLQAAVDKESLTEQVLDETMRHASDRRAWLVFCSGIDHAIHVAESLQKRGVSTKAVHSRMKREERDQVLADFKAGRLQAVTNNGILTTGFDYPAIDLILMLRPTRSPGLWVQMLGRGTRSLYAEGFDLSTREGRLAAIEASQKQDCLVLDFAGNTERLGPINDPMLPRGRRKGDKDAKAPVKVCEECRCIVPAATRKCPKCGHEFPQRSRLSIQASRGELIAVDDGQEIPVIDIRAQIHHKTGRPPSLRVIYSTGILEYSEWVCFEHQGYARKQAERWWLEGGGDMPIPSTVEEALARFGEISRPVSIFVRPKGRYFNITRRRFK